MSISNFTSFSVMIDVGLSGYFFPVKSKAKYYKQRMTIFKFRVTQMHLPAEWLLVLKLEQPFEQKYFLAWPILSPMCHFAALKWQFLYALYTAVIAKLFYFIHSLHHGFIFITAGHPCQRFLGPKVILRGLAEIRLAFHTISFFPLRDLVIHLICTIT